MRAREEGGERVNEITARMKISEKIYAHMKEHHMCQAEVARAAGMSPKMFNDILKCRKVFRAEQVMPICEALGCTPNDVL